ncbi:unnamed protein product [Prorocentrum cordatum]|uniref:Uncharacterized protein n=1 Tax=Prorocentrum cordatum TaxID=2364126 RepID=A0ABN9SKJ9_9DINO|nr:unnamed protein product [Polarella glacialis]
MSRLASHHLASGEPQVAAAAPALPLHLARAREHVKATPCGDCNCPEGQATSLLWASAAVALCSAGAGLAAGCAGASLLGRARQAAGAAWGCPSGASGGGGESASSARGAGGRTARAAALPAPGAPAGPSVTAMAARTLDIREAQVQVHYPDEDLEWHHRVLLHRVEGALWLGPTPDHEIVRVDLSVLRHHALDRSSAFPAQFAPMVHAFDPVDGQTLRDAKRQAQRRAALLGGGEVEDAEEYARSLASVADARCGEAVPADVVEDGDRCVTLGHRGVRMIDGEPRFVERVSRDERDSWVQSCREDVEDIRVLGDHRSRVGRRDLDLRDAVESMREVTVEDWPDQGPRACLEYLKSIALGAGNLLTYQAEWQRLSGVAEGGAQGHEHRCHLETLRRAICHDQLNVVNLTCFEHVVRRVIQVEMAVEKNPRHPDFSGLGDVLAGPRSASGSAHVPRHLEHPASGTHRRPGVSELPKKHWWPDGHWLHNDPFPLPIQYEEERPTGAARSTARRWHHRAKKQERVRETVEALDHLAASKTNSIDGKVHRVRPRGGPPTAVQRSALAHVVAGVNGYGEPPREATDGEWSLRAILKSADQYELEPRHLASYDPDKLHIASGALRPVPVSALLPEAAAGYLRHFESQVGLTAPELESRLQTAGGLPTPYWDPALRGDRSARRDFVRRLAAAGAVGFRRAIKSRCGAFFVHKKDGRIRFICDARQANLCHRRPPRTVLGGPASLSELDLSPLAEALGGYGGALELPHRPPRERGLDITHVYDDDLKGPTPVRTGELLYPVMRALPMGWSWALHFAQEAVTTLAERGCPGGSEQLLQDKRPAPLLRPGRPVSAVHVDNFTGLGGCQEDAAFGVRGFEKAAADAGLKLHVPEVAFAELESLGLGIPVSDKTLRHTPHRVWRFHFGTKELLRRGRCSPAELRAWAGHAVHLFSLQPLLLSILQDTYTFIGNGLGARRPLPRGVRLELRLAAALVFLGGVNLAAPDDDEVHVSDSSTGGHCLMYGRKPARALRGLPADDELEIPKFADVQLRAGRSAGAWSSTELGQLAFRKVGRTRRRQGCSAVGGRHRQEVELLNVAPKLPVALTRDEGWRRAVAGRWQHPEEHINIKEARACVMGLRRSCRGPRHHGHRVLSLRDNMVTCCCLDKGRSTSRALNTQRRRAAGYALGCGIRWRARHVPTDLCVADFGSRLHEPPEPQWLCAAKARRETALERSVGDRSASAEAGHAREPESAKVFLELLGHWRLHEVVRICQRCNVLWSIENPASSGLWSFPPVGGLAGLAGARWVKFPMCAYGVPRQNWAACLAKAAPTTAFGASPPFVEAWAGELEALVPRRLRGAAEGDARPADTTAGGDASCARADRYLAERGVLFGNTSAVERAAARARHAAAAGRSRADYLKLKGVSEATLALYRKGVDEFESWCRLNGRQNNNLVNVDANLVGWMTELYFAGTGPATGRNGLFGHLLLRGDNHESGVGRVRLPRARRQLKGWCKSDPGAVGMPYPLSVRWQLLADGEPRLAALAVIQTDCYLRPSEALALRPEDAPVGCADAGAEYAGKVVLHLAPGDRGRPTKTGISDDAVEDLDLLAALAGRAGDLESPNNYQSDNWEVEMDRQRLHIAYFSEQLTRQGGSYAELADKPASAARPDAPAPEAPKLNIEDLVAGTLNSFQIDLGKILSFAGGDDECEASKLQELDRRQKQLAEGLSELSTRLFSEALAKRNDKYRQLAHKDLAARILGVYIAPFQLNLFREARRETPRTSYDVTLDGYKGTSCSVSLVRLNDECRHRVVNVETRAGEARIVWSRSYVLDGSVAFQPAAQKLVWHPLPELRHKKKPFIWHRSEAAGHPGKQESAGGGAGRRRGLGGRGTAPTPSGGALPTRTGPRRPRAGRPGRARRRRSAARRPRGATSGTAGPAGSRAPRARKRRRTTWPSWWDTADAQLPQSDAPAGAEDLWDTDGPAADWPHWRPRGHHQGTDGHASGWRHWWPGAQGELGDARGWEECAAAECPAEGLEWGDRWAAQGEDHGMAY